MLFKIKYFQIVRYLEKLMLDVLAFGENLEDYFEVSTKPMEIKKIRIKASPRYTFNCVHEIGDTVEQYYK